jgi:hypothetical protein
MNTYQHHQLATLLPESPWEAYDRELQDPELAAFAAAWDEQATWERLIKQHAAMATVLRLLLHEHRLAYLSADERAAGYTCTCPLCLAAIDALEGEEPHATIYP